MKLITGAIVALSALVLYAEAAPSEPAAPFADKPKVEIYKLALWTRSGYCTSKGGCLQLGENASIPTWTVHGLWPSTKNGTVYSGNCTNARFNKTDVQPIVKELNNKWPSFTTTPSESVWEEEYNKHGTCALSPINSTLKYFQKALKLYGANPVSQWLAKVNVTPNDIKTFPLDKIKGGILNGSLTPTSLVDFHCEGQRNGSDILQEIRFCYDTDLERVSCPPQNSTCTTKNVWYLKSSSSIGMPSVLILLVATFFALFTSRN